MIDYDRYRAALERTYEDIATVYRYEAVKDPVSKVTKQLPVGLHAGIPCRISQTTLPKNGQTAAQNDVRYDAKLFLSPDIPVLQGDLIEVVRAGQTRRYETGEPFLYPTHQEIGLTRKEWA
ncbi:ABC transporter ATP-binding protein [Gorillibacterium sp. sgz500922]|uniref:ABC transporter ATP-binding protein n=1 Tax=Gorillibacterium sp. sgz500922 TaxID=3446694 RepID=UPI003F669212